MTDKPLQAPLSEPTDPRIAELIEELPTRARKTSGYHNRRVMLQAAQTLSLLQQRLEQVTAERDEVRAELAAHAQETLEMVMRLTVAKEAAEATIASLTSALMDFGQHKADCTRQNCKGQCSCGFSRLADEGGLLDSLPSSAVSRTAERQP